MGKIWDFHQYGAAKAYIDSNGTVIRYYDLEYHEKRIADIVGGKELVFCLCSNTLGSAVGYAALLNSGAVPVMLSGNLETGLMDTLLDLYKPSYLWLPDEKADNDPVYKAAGYSLVKTGLRNKCMIYDGLALLLTTSGSTGSPKFVRQSYDNIRANTESIVRYLEIDPTERPITTLPMNYTYGLSIINTHLYVGATILLTEYTLMQKEFWSFFKEQGATSFGGVPYTYEMLNKLKIYRMELPTLRTMTQAGGKLTPELHERFARYADETERKFVVMYGQCEATARMGYLPADKAVEKKGSMGIAIPGGRFSLIDVEGHEIDEANVTGELVYKGKNVTLGYAECADDLKKGDERHGVLITGDMARRDEDGYYYIVGRKKRFLKIYGNRVNLDEMDRLIKGKYEIEVACAGIDDCMYIFITDENIADEVRSYAVGKTGLNPAAFRIMVIETIPKNDSGKVLYSELSKYYKEIEK